MVYAMLKSGPIWGSEDLVKTVENMQPGQPNMCSSDSGVYLYDSSSRYSPRSLLFRDRTIIFSGVVDEGSSESAMEQLLALDSIAKEENKDIVMYINSPGGYIAEGLVVYDTMQHIKSEISTVVTGMAASMASVLLVAGAKGKRYALPNSTIMLHEASGGAYGRFSHIDITKNFSDSQFDRLLDIYIQHMNRDKDGYFTKFGGETNMVTLDEMKPTKMDEKELKVWLKKWLEKDRYMTPKQAMDLGIIDGIIEGKKGRPK